MDAQDHAEHGLTDRETTVGELTADDIGKSITFTHQTLAMRPGHYHVHTYTGTLARFDRRDGPGGHVLYRVWVEGRDGYWPFSSQARCVVHG